MPDDAELLRRYTAGSQAAFAELVARHIDLVYSAALRQVGGDAHCAHDVAQVVFAALARKASALVAHPALAGWLYNTTRHVARRAMRAERRRRAREAEALHMNEAEQRPAEWERIGPVLDAAMGELGERDRAAVVLRFFARRPFAEIGRALGLSDDAARMRVDRALEKLRARLGRHGVTSTAAALALALANQAIATAPTGVAASVTAAASTSASAITAGGALAAAVHFMSTSKVAVTAAAVVAVLSCATAVHEVRASRAAEETLREARTRELAAAAKLRAMSARTNEVLADAARAEKTPPPAAPARPAAPSTGFRPFANRPQVDAAATTAFMARHPEVEAVARAQLRASAAGRMGGVFRLLELSPNQIEQFLSLKTARDRLGLIRNEDGTLRLMIEAANADQIEPELRVLLGEEKFQQFKSINEVAQSAWRRTAELAGDLYISASPLSSGQADAVFRIFVAERMPATWTNQPQFDWDRVITRAQQVLSAEQLEALRHVAAQDRFSQEFTRARVRGELQ